MALVAALTPVGTLEYMVNIGTLAAFTLVSIAVPVLRRKRPDLPRPFKVPGSPWLPLLAAAVAIYLMLTLPVETWIRFIAWMRSASSRTSPTGTGARGCPGTRTPTRMPCPP